MKNGHIVRGCVFGEQAKTLNKAKCDIIAQCHNALHNNIARA